MLYLYCFITGNGVVVACVIPVLFITGNGIVVACVIPVLFYYR